jgi:hypothetical protein
MKNHRTISLLTVFSKVMEKVIYNRLSHHMHTSNILVPEQFGFRQGSSTDNAAFKLIGVYSNLSIKKRHVSGIFCDLANVFDCVYHEILLVKVHNYGIQEQ